MCVCVFQAVVRPESKSHDDVRVQLFDVHIRFLAYLDDSILKLNGHISLRGSYCVLVFGCKGAAANHMKHGTAVNTVVAVVTFNCRTWMPKVPIHLFANTLVE